MTLSITPSPFASGSDKSTTAQSTDPSSAVADASESNDLTSTGSPANASTSISSTSHAYVRSSSISITRKGGIGWEVQAAAAEALYPGTGTAQGGFHAAT